MITNIFGPYTNPSADSYEKNVLLTLLSKNSLMIPQYVGRNVVSEILSSRDLRTPFNGSPALDYLNDGYIIPFDLLSEEALFSKDFIRSSESKYYKRPDFIFAKKKKGRLSVYPIDIKEGDKLELPVEQVSAFNLAGLIKNSKFLKSCLDELSERLSLEVRLKPGFMLSENKFSDNREVLDSLYSSTISAKYDSDSRIVFDLGIPVIGRSESEPFSIKCKLMSVASLYNHLNYIKNRIYNKGFYPLGVEVYFGFNLDGSPRLQLQYDPQKGINTLSPDLDDLKSKLSEIKSESSIVLNEMRVNRLHDEFLTALTRKVKWAKIGFERAEEDVDRLYLKISDLNARRNSSEKVDGNLLKLSKKLEELQKSVSSKHKIYSDLLEQKASEFLRVQKEASKYPWYTPEGHKRNEELRQSLIKNLESQVMDMSEKLELRQTGRRRGSKSSRKKRVTNYRKSDLRINEKIREFNESLEFTFANTKRQHPSIFYIRLGDDVVEIKTFERLEL